VPVPTSPAIPNFIDLGLFSSAARRVLGRRENRGVRFVLVQSLLAALEDGSVVSGHRTRYYQSQHRLSLAHRLPGPRCSIDAC
jgi:hypothetical protein